MDGNEIDAIRALLSSKPRPVGWLQRRERLDEVGSVWPVADDVSLDEVDLDGVPGEWSIAPGSDATRVLIFFHGGGYCSGSILSHRCMVTEAGRAAGVRTLAVGYRLAPEHPFPAAFDDALTAWRFLRRQGVTPRRIAIGGDSAGGGLAVVLMNRLRDAREEPPGCAWLVSPWTDLTMSGETLATKDDVDPIIHKAYLDELADAYLSGEVDRMDPRVSPLYSDLKGLPPTLIQIGSAETLLADATRLAAAAGERGEPPPGRPRTDGTDRRPDWPNDLCEIVYVDHFGNAMTGLMAAMLPPNARFVAAGRVLDRERTFSDRPPGAAFRYENSNGLAEIAVNQGRADRDLRLAIGIAVEIVF